MSPFFFIIISIILFLSGQINVVAQQCSQCKNSLNCTTNSDCTSSDYKCVSAFCQLKRCPSETCQPTVTCTVQKTNYVCTCRGQVISSTKHCWLEYAFIATIVVFLVLCLFPLITVLIVTRCHPASPGGGKRLAWTEEGGEHNLQDTGNSEKRWEDYGFRAFLWTPMFESADSAKQRKNQGSGKQGSGKYLNRDRDLEKNAPPAEKAGLITEQKSNREKGSKKQLNTTDVEKGEKSGGNEKEGIPMGNLDRGKSKSENRLLANGSRDMSRQKSKSKANISADKPPFFPEPRKELPRWIPQCCQCRCLKKALSLPYKMMFSIFSICCDFFNCAATLYLFVSDDSQFIETHDYAYLFISADAIVMFCCECLVVWTVFHKVEHPEVNHWCIYPGHYKFWMVVFYFPNMCALSPFVGLLKVWYTVGDTGYSVYFFATGFQQTEPAIVKILALCLRVPYAFSQMAMLMVVLHKRWKMDHVVVLTTEEWYQVFAQAMKSWKENVPNIMDILIAKYKYEHNTNKAPTDLNKHHTDK